jgi:hypothetical protein
MIKRCHVGPCFEMLDKVVESCPDELWLAGDGSSMPVWQIVYHTCAGAWVWFRPAGEPFTEPPMGGAVAELETPAERGLSKAEVRAFAAEAKRRAERFLAAAGCDWITAPYSHYSKMSNLDVVIGQVRHLQHHIGYCNRILSAHGVAVPWQEANRG